METPLTQVYFMERCNACGRSYPLHLHGIHERQQLDEEWQSARPCESCITQQERTGQCGPRAGAHSIRTGMATACYGA